MSEQANTQTAPEAQFMIQRVYVKDLSFETPNSPAVFQQEWQPEMNLDLNTQTTKLDDQTFEVVLTLTVTVANKGATAFLVEVKQAGIFSIVGAQGPQMDHLLGSFCPNILFPYAREAITAQVMRGSFPQLVLAPINFDALYMQQMQERQNAQQAQVEEVAH